jgi:lipopolysaccharide/colanic/teichoic acid biosynthesis glycosyltransferase
MLYDRLSDEDLALFTLDLVRTWRHPDSVIPDIVQIAPKVWAPRGTALDTGLSFVGGAWIGTGRTIGSGATVLGPAALWDSPESRPAYRRDVRWHEIEPTDAAAESASDHPARKRSRSQTAKRLFDIVFSLLALAVTLPLYPFIMFAIWMEDGWPFFFAHTRETLGGREFGCLKFRSMRKDAEQVKEKLRQQNRADGPQFFIQDDPRLTRVGRFIRRRNLDELPQFFNVLLGQMSVVGPRPSPHKENQFCPAWREARLSVRPGITGLWQVRRTRRPGADFQEWIKYDLEYVHKRGWKLDLMIILKTFGVFFGR